MTDHTPGVSAVDIQALVKRLDDAIAFDPPALRRMCKEAAAALSAQLWKHTRATPTPAEQGDLVERLRKPIAADSIYDWIVQKRKQTTSDLPRQGFCNEMELIDEQRTEAADMISTLRTQLAERDETIAGMLAENEHLSRQVVSGVLGDLLNTEEHDALVDFIKFLRTDPEARQALTSQVPHG